VVVDGAKSWTLFLRPCLGRFGVPCSKIHHNRGGVVIKILHALHNNTRVYRRKQPGVCESVCKPLLIMYDDDPFIVLKETKFARHVRERFSFCHRLLLLFRIFITTPPLRHQSENLNMPYPNPPAMTRDRPR
jgi:hypothetical protein